LAVAAAAQILAFPLLPHLLPVKFDLVDSVTGRRSFPVRLSLEEVLHIHVERVSISDGAITIEVTLAGHPVSQLAVLLLVEPDRVFA